MLRKLLVSDTDAGAATNYYPSAAGLTLPQTTAVGIQGYCDGDVTTTIEASFWEKDDASEQATAVWVDVTACFKNLGDDSTANASFANLQSILLANGILAQTVRIKSVVVGTGNTEQYWIITAN